MAVTVHYYKVGDHMHYTVRGVRHCGIVTSVDETTRDGDMVIHSYTAQENHPDNADCEWAIEADIHRRVLAWSWMNQ